MDIQSIAKKINKAWGENTLTTGVDMPHVDKISMGSISCDYSLYGGIPTASLIIFSGVEHSGKSLSACLAMAQYQKKYPDKVCIYVDAENTLPVQVDFISQMTGLIIDDPNRFLRYDCTGKSAEEIFDDIVMLQEADNIGMIVLDSAPALVSQSDIDNPIAKDMGMRASIAKSLGKFIKRMLNMLAKKNNILLIINQVRVDGTTFTGAKVYSEPGGHALNYYPSLKIRFGTRTFTKGDNTNLYASKSEDADGFRLKFSITKSRVGKTDRGGGFITFRYDKGVDVLNDTLEVALKFGYIERPTTQSYVIKNLETNEPMYLDGEELRFVGKAKLLAFLQDNPDFTEKYLEMLHNHISEEASKVDLLDEETMKEILDQEEALSGKK